jgi:hypothetical protein
LLSHTASGIEDRQEDADDDVVEGDRVDGEQQGAADLR